MSTGSQISFSELGCERHTSSLNSQYHGLKLERTNEVRSSPAHKVSTGVEMAGTY